MQSDQQMQKPSQSAPVPTESVDVRPQEASGETIKHRLSALMHRVQHSIWPVNGSGAVTVGVSPAAHADGGDHALISQVNALDHQHMQAFPAHRKAQVMEKIMSLTPVANVLSQGNNKFEKAVMNLHREGYGLIDLQPQETVFTSVWYRKSRALVGKGADVTMLLWEDDEGGASVTMMSWRI